MSGTTPNFVRWMSKWDLGTSKTPYDMLLKVFAGEVLAAYQDYVQFPDKVNYYTLNTGKEMQFPAVWKIGSEYLEAGARTLSMDVETKEYTISLEDNPLYSQHSEYKLDDMLAHFQVRAQIRNEMAKELARQVDKKISILIRNACNGVAEGTATSFPNQIIASGAISKANINAAEATYTGTALNNAATALIEALTQIAIVWDRNFIPQNDRYVAVTPAMFYALRTQGVPSFLNTASATGNTAGLSPYPLMGSPQATFVSGPNTVGGTGPDVYLEYLGFKIFRSQNTPWGASAITTGPSKWQADFSTTYAMAFQKDCVGFIQKTGIVTENWYNPETLSDNVRAMTWVGGGTLRPYCACRITT